MKKTLSVLLLSSQLCAFAEAASLYPPSFTWSKYVGPVIDQVRQKTCTTHAAVGGMETMYNLYYGFQPGPRSLDLSERFAFAAIGGGSIEQTLSFAQNNGIVTAACEPYVTTAPDEDLGEGMDFVDGQPVMVVNKVYTNGFQKFQLECADKRRFKPTYEDVTANVYYGNGDGVRGDAGDDEAVKYLLVNRGPLMVHFYEPTMHPTDHAYVLHGWSTDSSGRTVWLYRDSWPEHFSMQTRSTVSPTSIFNRGSVTDSQAFVVTDVTEERNVNGTWVPVYATRQPFELDAANQLVTVNKPNSCDNQGTYSLSNLERLDGANVYNWSVRGTDTGNLRIEQRYVSKYLSTATLTGDGKGVTIVATLRRPNGMLENVTKTLGEVGSAMPQITLDQRWNCLNKSVDLSVRNPFPGGTLSVPAGANYTVSSNNASSLTIRFTAPAGPSVYYAIPGAAGCPGKSGRIANIAPLCN